jgi:hypothetical protein
VDDHCRVCGPHWDAITGGLCLLHLERALDATRHLLDLLDTSSDLRDVRIRQDWVWAVQIAGGDLADRLGYPT